ncbi:MAG: aldehyde dehydrogenase family protein, partial [Marivivens sp.]
MQELTHFINGEHVKGTSGRFSDVYNPATGEIIAKVPLASDEEMDAAIKAAEKAQVEWAKVNPQRRARVMMKFGQLINEHMEELAELVAREHGKTIPDARGDVQRG